MSKKKHYKKSHSKHKRDLFQVAAFKSFYRAAIIGKCSLTEAFAYAIAKSSDDETDRLLAKDRFVINRWYSKMLKGIRRNNEAKQINN